MSGSKENYSRFEQSGTKASTDEGFLSKIKTMMKESPVKFYLICGGILAALIIIIVIIAVAASGNKTKKEDPVDDGKLHWNETLIDELLLTFPKRENMTYEQYLGNLTYYRDKYKLNTENAVLLSYKWVSQNIYYKVSSNDPKKVYEAGHGDCYGYAFLFNADCEALGFKIGEDVYNVHGTARVASTCNETFTGENHMWNAIKIRGKWYLTDQERGYSGSDPMYYFLVDPYLMIRDHWPDKPEYQHLDTPITLKQYCGSIYTFKAFGYCGFYKIEPDLPEFNTTTGEGNIKIYFRDPNVNFSRVIGNPDKVDVTKTYTNLTQYSGHFQIDYKFPTDKRGRYSAVYYCQKPPKASKRTNIASAVYIYFNEK